MLKKDLLINPDRIDEEAGLNPEELDTMNRERARETLGDEFSEDQYQEWLSKNKAMLGELKIKNPIAYTTFMEDFQVHKTNLQTKGVI